MQTIAYDYCRVSQMDGFDTQQYAAFWKSGAEVHDDVTAARRICSHCGQGCLQQVRQGYIGGSGLRNAYVESKAVHGQQNTKR